MELKTGTDRTTEGSFVTISACSGVRDGDINVQRQESGDLENVMVADCQMNVKAVENGSLIILGRNYQCMKPSCGMLTTECQKRKDESEKQAKGRLETRNIDCQTLPVLSGPCFRPWSRGKKGGRREHDKGDDCQQQEYRRHENEPHEVYEIPKGKHSNNCEEFICFSTPCKLLESAVQGRGLVKESHAWEHTEPEVQAWQSTKTEVPSAERKESEFLNVKLLRRKLISFYDHGPAIQPFETIVGETLNHEHHPSDVKFPPVFQQEIFPFAVPYLRLPLLPTSRHHLGKISEVLTSCELLPWQRQDITSEYKREQIVKPLDSKTQSNPKINDEYGSRKETEGKKGLQVFIPTE